MGKLRWFVVIAAFLCGSILNWGEAGLQGLKKKSWSYTPIQFNSTSSDENKFKSSITVQRTSRTQLGLVGKMLVNYDMNDGTTVIELLSYRSATSKMEWKHLPFTLQKQALTQFMNSFYKQMLMSSLDGCSNFPIFEVFKPPFEKKLYELKNCVIAIDNLPDHMQEGYYKVDLFGHGEVEWNIQFILKIDKEDE